MGESAQVTITNLGNGIGIRSPCRWFRDWNFRSSRRSRRFEFVNGTTLAIDIDRGARDAANGRHFHHSRDHAKISSPWCCRSMPSSAAGSYFVPRNAGPQLAAHSYGRNDAQRHSPDRRTAPPSFGLSVPKREVYVGESVPVEIEVGMRSGFVSSLNGLPEARRATTSRSTISRVNPSAAKRSSTASPSYLLTWRSDLAVGQAGHFLALGRSAAHRENQNPTAKRESLLDDQFGDPFLQNFFGATVPKDIKVCEPAGRIDGIGAARGGAPGGLSAAPSVPSKSRATFRLPQRTPAIR